MRARSIQAGALVLALALGSFAVTSQAESVQQGKVRVRFEGTLTPKTLPRQGARPVGVSIGGQVITTDGSEPPQLRRIELEINRHGRIDYHGMPACRLEQIQPSTNRDALRACRRSKVGEGRFFANVAIPGQAPFPSRGRLIAFNGVEHGRPVIFAHVYGTEPVPSSYTLPFFIDRARGTFSTKLTTSLPRVTGKAGFITGIQLSLHRTFTYNGERHSYLSAGCPAPDGFPSTVFKFARVTFSFPGKKLSRVLSRSCRARG